MSQYLVLFLALFLNLTGQQAQPPSPAAPAGADATQEVMEWVDTLFSADSVDMYCFVFPGTGPVVPHLDRDTFYEPVRALFASRSWVKQESWEEDYTYTPGDWSLSLTGLQADGQHIIIALGTGSTEISCGIPSEDGSRIFWYHSEDTGENLAHALSDLWGGPEVRYALVTVPDTGESTEKIAEAYAGAFRKEYLTTDAITDLKLEKVIPLAPPEDTEYTAASFSMTYSVKPADLAATCWQYTGYQSVSDGWLTYTVDIHMSPREDGVWCLSYYEITPLSNH